MPAIALGVGRAAILTRLLRASMLEIIRMEYVTTARAKGLGENLVILKHALKNALIPTVTIMGLQIGFLIGGAIVVETLLMRSLRVIISRCKVSFYSLLLALWCSIFWSTSSIHFSIPASVITKLMMRIVKGGTAS
jgi:ABC-type microcin C transport system permease subunit YejB